MKKLILLISVYVAANVAVLVSCAVAAQKVAVGYPVDAEPMSGVCVATRCLGKQLQCLGQDGQWHTVANCQNACVNGRCQ